MGGHYGWPLKLVFVHYSCFIRFHQFILFPSATSDRCIRPEDILQRYAGGCSQVQFEEAQLSHRSNEPEKNEDQTEDEADLARWSHSQFAPMTIHITVQPSLVRFFKYIIDYYRKRTIRRLQSYRRLSRRVCHDVNHIGVPEHVLSRVKTLSGSLGRETVCLSM